MALDEEPADPDPADPEDPEEPADPEDEPDEPDAPEEPADPDDEPDDEPSPPGVVVVSVFFATCFAFFAVFAFAVFAWFAPVFIGATLLSFSVLSVGATATWSALPGVAAVLDGTLVELELVIGALEALLDGVLLSEDVVELGVLDGVWFSDVESLLMLDDVDDGFAVELDVVVVLGALLFLLWLPRANADPLASAMIDVMTNIGASLRI